jgi:hypothetical protein
MRKRRTKISQHDYSHNTLIENNGVSLNNVVQELISNLPALPKINDRSHSMSTADSEQKREEKPVVDPN